MNLKFSKSYIFLRFGSIKDSIIENQQKGAEKSGVWIWEEKPLIWAMCEKNFYEKIFYYYYLVNARIFGTLFLKLSPDLQNLNSKKNECCKAWHSDK